VLHKAVAASLGSIPGTSLESLRECNCCWPPPLPTPLLLTRCPCYHCMWTSLQFPYCPGAVLTGISACHSWRCRTDPAPPCLLGPCPSTGPQAALKEGGSKGIDLQVGVLDMAGREIHVWTMQVCARASVRPCKCASCRLAGMLLHSSTAVAVLLLRRIRRPGAASASSMWLCAPPTAT